MPFVSARRDQLWERWDGWTADKGFQNPGMNSFAHYSFGAVARWMFQTVAGIDTDGLGFQRLVSGEYRFAVR